MSKTKVYSVKDVDMLFAAQGICHSLRDNQPELVTVRTNWTLDYIDNLEGRIKNAINNFLGLDCYNALRSSTHRLYQITTPAWRDLSFIRTQIKADFGAESEFILKELGLGSYTKSNRNSQQELTSFLIAFRRGMSDELRTRIVSKGTNPELIDRLIDYATAVIEANNEQEKMKQTSKTLSHEARTALNDIYKEIIGICKIASSYYRDNPVKKEQFVFSKVTRRLGQSTNTPETVVDEKQ